MAERQSEKGLPVWPPPAGSDAQERRPRGPEEGPGPCTRRGELAELPGTFRTRTAMRTIFAQADRTAAHAQLAEVVRAPRPRWRKAAEILGLAEADIMAYMVFPGERWTRIYSASSLDRLSSAVKRRTQVVGGFPDGGSARAQPSWRRPPGYRRRMASRQALLRPRDDG